MKVTYSWLKEFVDLKASPQELAEKLTMAGLEVVSLQNSGQDSVFEIEITSNRPDWLSVEGVAREAAAVYGLKFKAKTLKETKPKKGTRLDFKISVEEKKDCPFYSARVICGVKVGASPEWLKNRLEALGVRSVNNVVDITNYVLFETGHPLHAFDLDVLNEKEIIVRRAKENEKIITIDGKTVVLDASVLVIADKKEPVAVAGIMGGKQAEVSEKTKNILLESAVFDPVLVRRAKKKLALQSDSAYRFERGVDFENAQKASLYAQELILKLASGSPCGYKSTGTIKTAQTTISLDAGYVKKLLGLTVSGIKIKQVLKSLGLEIKQKKKDVFSVKVPGFRRDLTLAVDLIEEIARIYGFSKITSSIPAIRPARDICGKGEVVSNIKTLLCGLGLYEVITYSLLERSLLKKLQTKEVKPVEVLNPLSREQEVLRTTLLPGMVGVIARNLDRGQDDMALFEIADVYFVSGASAKEELRLCLGICRDNVSPLHLKGILEILFKRLGINDFSFIRRDIQRIDVLANGNEAGFILDLNQRQLDDFGIKKPGIILGEIDLEKLLNHINLNKKFSGIPKFPSITRDISFIVKNEVPVASILSVIVEKSGPLLKEAKIRDYYQGKQIPEGFKGLTISCTYRLEDRTLTEEEVNPAHNQISFLLVERFDIKLR